MGRAANGSHGTSRYFPRHFPLSGWHCHWSERHLPGGCPMPSTFRNWSKSREKLTENRDGQTNCMVSLMCNKSGRYVKHSRLLEAAMRICRLLGPGFVAAPNADLELTQLSDPVTDKPSIVPSYADLRLAAPLYLGSRGASRSRSPIAHGRFSRKLGTCDWTPIT